MTDSDRGDAEKRRAGADSILVAELARGATLKDAAKSAGVSERTARRRNEEDDFRAKVNAVRSEMLSSAIGRLSDAMAGSAETLSVLAQSAGSENVRLSAARGTLEMAVRLRESLEFSERLDRLEQAMLEEQ
jgi:hypothetical protein